MSQEWSSAVLDSRFSVSPVQCFDPSSPAFLICILEMACMGVSDRDMSMSVEQKHRPIVSICHLPPVKKSFSSSRPESTLSTICTNQSSFPSPPTVTSLSPELTTCSRYLSVKNKTMSRSTEQLSVIRQPRAQHLFIQSAHALPRSISMADLHLVENAPHVQRSGLELRRVPPSIDDLRQFVDKQDDTIPKQTHPDFLLSRLVESRGVPERNHLIYGDSMPAIKRQRRGQRYGTYQDMHILSMYSESSSVFSTSSEEMVRKNSVQSQNSSGSGSSYDSSLKPKTPTEYLPFESLTDLKELDSTEEERIRRFNARRVQVMEHNYEMNDSTDEYEEIMQATMLIGPGKPKLVDIQCPASSNTSKKNEYSPTQSSQVSQPTTPVRTNPEISLFSPFDTPASGTPFSDISTVTGSSTPSPRQSRLSIGTSLSNYRARFFTPLRQPHSTSTIFNTEENKRRNFVDTFESPLSQRSNRASTVSSFAENSSMTSRYTYSSERSTMRKQSNVAQIAQMEAYHHSIFRTISATTKALDALAAGKFNLSCQELFFFRKIEVDNSVDSTLLCNLKKIFPQSSSGSLSTLAAWLIVDNHFVDMFATAPPSEAHRAVKSSYTLFPFDQNMTHSTEYPPAVADAPWMGLADTKEAKMLNCRERMLSSPNYPSTIPSKARSILGISSDPAGCRSQPFLAGRPSHSVVDQNDESLEGKARSVHSSVQTIGRKLVKDVVSESLPPPMETSVPARRLKSVRSAKSAKGRNTATSPGSPVNELDQGMVNALWQACCCMASMI